MLDIVQATRGCEDMPVAHALHEAAIHALGQKEDDVPDRGRVAIPVEMVEFDDGGRAMWVQGAKGTVLRISLPPGFRFRTVRCTTNPCSHADIRTDEPRDVEVCLADDATTPEAFGAPDG